MTPLLAGVACVAMLGILCLGIGWMLSRHAPAPRTGDIEADAEIGRMATILRTEAEGEAAFVAALEGIPLQLARSLAAKAMERAAIEMRQKETVL